MKKFNKFVKENLDVDNIKEEDWDNEETMPKVEYSKEMIWVKIVEKFKTFYNFEEKVEELFNKYDMGGLTHDLYDCVAYDLSEYLDIPNIIEDPNIEKILIDIISEMNDIEDKFNSFTFAALFKNKRNK